MQQAAAAAASIEGERREAALARRWTLPYPVKNRVPEGSNPVPTMTDETHIPGGVVHDLPGDLKDALKADSRALATWEDITPLARNEWICWIESAKKLETRRKRIDWGRSNLSEGKRRPCCWPGCPHRGKDG